MSATASAPALEWRRFADLPSPLLYEVLQFRQAIFIVEQRCAYPDLDDRDQGAEHLLLWAGGELAGYLRLMPSSDRTRVAIGRVAVGALHRGRGLACLMMRAALARCRCDHDGQTVVLTAQTYLVPFYESLGFRATSAPFDDYGLDHVEMILTCAGS